MTVRIPVKYDGNNIVEMTTGERTEWHAYIAYLYAQGPTVTCTVVSGSGTLTPAMTDTRFQAGAGTTHVSAFVAEGTTAEPSTVTVAYDKITGPTYDTSGAANADLGAVGYPLYALASGDLQVMTITDYRDTFIYATLTAMGAATESAATNGTYTISTSATATHYTEVSNGSGGTPVYLDTRANAAAYTAAGITETLDQPTTINTYYLHRQSRARSFPSAACLFAESGGDIIQGPLAADSSTFNAALANDIKYYAAEDSGGYKISYNIGGAGNSRGTAMVDTKLDNAAGTYTTNLVNINDYRAQEFPAGNASTIATHVFKIDLV